MWDIGDTLSSHGVSIGRMVLDIREKLTRIAAAAKHEGDKVTEKVGPPNEAGAGGSDTSSFDAGGDDYSTSDEPEEGATTSSDEADPDADGAGLGDITGF